jgi:hypothetical protein
MVLNDTESYFGMTVDIYIRRIHLTDKFGHNDSQLGYTLTIHDEYHHMLDNYSDIKSITNIKLVYVHGTMAIDMMMQMHAIASNDDGNKQIDCYNENAISGRLISFQSFSMSMRPTGCVAHFSHGSISFYQRSIY